MLLSKRHKFIFFHIPKVAGSSITKALRPYSDYPVARVYNYMIDYLGPRPFINLYPMHIKPIELKDQMNHFNNYFKFAFVRNPWDWHISQFMFHKQNSYTYFYETFKKMIFSDYVDWAIQEENMSKANSKQKQFLSDERGNLLVDFVGKFENLNSDYEYVRNKIGVGKDMPKINPSVRNSNYKDYYSSLLASKIANAFAEDIDYFNYKF